MRFRRLSSVGGRVAAGLATSLMLGAINDTGIATGFYYPTAQAAQNFQPTAVTYNTVTGVMTPIPVKKKVTA